METRREQHNDYSGLIEQLLAPWDCWEAQPGRYRAQCPIHGGENNTSFSIFQNGRWRCFKCGAWGDMPRLLVALQGLTLAQAREALALNVIPVFRSIEQLPVLPPWKDRKPKEEYPVMRDAFLGAFRKFCPEYLLARGFSQPSLKHFEIGYDVPRHKIVLPVRDAKARLVGVTYRLDFDGDKDQPAKYWHDNFLKSYHLYGYHLFLREAKKRLFLVEGQLDAVRMWQLGYGAAAVMGSDLSKEQVALITQYCRAEQVVLAFDNDEAGEKVTRQAVKLLAPTRFGPKLALLKYPTNDPGELNEAHKLSLTPWYRSAIVG